MGARRRRDAKALREVEEGERGGGRLRRDEPVEGVERYGGRDWYLGSGYRRNRSRRDAEEARGGGRDEPAVQFKGRGSMKYRERN